MSILPPFALPFRILAVHNIFERIVAMIGALCISIALLVIGIITYFYYYLIITRLENPIHWPFSVWLLALILFNYVMSFVKVNQSMAPNRMLSDSLDNEREALQGWRSCNQCVCWRPPRAYHCRICGYCVLKRDHHCPWINGCVGLHNHRYFFFFLVYMSLGCLYVSLSVVHLLFFNGGNGGSNLSSTQHSQLLFCLVTSGIFGVILTGLTAFHAYLISTNQTNIEYVKNDLLATTESRMRGEHEFNQGIYSNWLMFLNVTSSQPWFLFLLPLPILPYTDGLSYPKYNKSSHSQSSHV